MLPGSVTPSNGSNRLRTLADMLGDALAQALAVAEADVRKLRHDPWELVTRMAQPALWLRIFVQVLARARAIPTGPIGYVEFVAPGILAQSVLFVAIFHGVSLIWEHDLGIVHKYLVSPAPRAALVLGRALASSVRGISQAVVVYVLAALVMLGSSVFSTFSLVVACIVKTRERFMGIGQVLALLVLTGVATRLYPRIVD